VGAAPETRLPPRVWGIRSGRVAPVDGARHCRPRQSRPAHPRKCSQERRMQPGRPRRRPGRVTGDGQRGRGRGAWRLARRAGATAKSRSPGTMNAAARSSAAARPDETLQQDVGSRSVYRRELYHHPRHTGHRHDNVASAYLFGPPGVRQVTLGVGRAIGGRTWHGGDGRGTGKGRLGSSTRSPSRQSASLLVPARCSASPRGGRGS